MQIKSLNHISGDARQEPCAVCGQVAQVHRRYNDEVYCMNCYYKWFPQKECERCHRLKRIHRHAKICSECKRNTDCVRCGKAAGTFPIGKITTYGAVCNACAIYFRQEVACFECGELSRNLSRSPKAPHNELLCVKCYRRYTFATCKNCRRYRKMHNEEKQLCRKCDEIGHSICSKCKNEMSAGYGNRCENCAKRELLFNFIKIHRYLFRSEAIRKAHRRFIIWYKNKVGISITLQKSEDYVSFFMACDDKWQGIPDYAALATEFKPSGLRKVLVVLNWLIDTKQVIVDESLKSELAELDRIQNLLNKLHTIPLCIATYYRQLQQKYESGKTSLKSIRLALQPAIDLMVSAPLNKLPSQEQLNAYLLAKKGQIAAITGFVNHLKNEHNHEILLNRDYILRERVHYLKAQATKQLAVLYKQATLTLKEQKNLLRVALYCLHRLEVKSPDIADITVKDGTAYYQADRNYFIPQDLYEKITGKSLMLNDSG